MAKRKALGKGLSALIPEAETENRVSEGYFQCPIEQIEPNPLQPRSDFSDSDMEELVNSIEEKGVITPLIVSKSGDGYKLIAGERRWRASQKAGLKRVPVVVRETTPTESLELALIENIHRKDLNPLEEALAYRRWLDDTKGTQETLSKRVGKERSTITNMLRLLNLPDIIQKDLLEGRLSMGHARVLAGLNVENEQRSLRDLIVKKELTVRQTEDYLKKKKSVRKPSKRDEKDTYMESVANDIKNSLGTKVEIKRRGKRGTINIFFYSDDELDRLIDRLT